MPKIYCWPNTVYSVTDYAVTVLLFGVLTPLTCPTTNFFPSHDFSYSWLLMLQDRRTCPKASPHQFLSLLFGFWHLCYLMIFSVIYLKISRRSSNWFGLSTSSTVHHCSISLTKLLTDCFLQIAAFGIATQLQSTQLWPEWCSLMITNTAICMKEVLKRGYKWQTL